MINLENYVCRLDQSKKLGALLGKRESLFYWVMSADETSVPTICRYPITNGWNAYTSQELDEEISILCRTYSVSMLGGTDFIKFKWSPTKNNSRFSTDKTYEYLFNVDGSRGAEARAEFLIYLLMNE